MNFYDKINELYNKQTYYQRYGLDIWKSIILIAVVILTISFIHIKANSHKIKSNWINERCKPNVMPFAGFINSQTGGKENSLDYTFNNFNQCVNNVVSDVSKYLMAPFHYNLKTMETTFKGLSENIVAKRGMFSNLRKNVEKIGGNTYNRTLESTIPLLKNMIYTKDTLHRTTGTITSAIYTLFGGYITLIGFFRFMYDLIIDVIVILVGIIIFCFAIGWLFPPTLIAGIGLSIGLIALLVPVIGIQTFMADALNATDTRNPPNVPSYCFGKNTKIQMRKGEWKEIDKIQPGDILIDNNLVTAIMCSTIKYSDMYKIIDVSNNNEIIVSSSHLIIGPEGNWICVSEHPNAIKLEKDKENNDGEDELIYCLGTSTKKIKIGNYVFSDWDEMDENDYKSLEINNKIYNILPNKFTKYDVHKYLDTGFHMDTFIPLMNGGKKRIKDIKVNDILKDNIEVCSIVKVFCKDIVNYYDYYFIDDDENKRYLFQGTNHIYLGELDVNNRLNRKKRNSKTKYILDNELKKIRKHKPFYVYHIVTNKGYFIYDRNIKVMDYNHSIERFLYT